LTRIIDNQLPALLLRSSGICVKDQTHFWGAKKILPEFPQSWPKNFSAANFCQRWLLIIN